MKPRLVVQQKITAFANKYKIFEVDSTGKPTTLKAFAQQKRLAFKEKVIFYDTEDKANEEFTFRAEKVMDVHGKYFIEDTSGLSLGVFQKQFKKSLVNSTWHVLDPQQNTVFIVRESNQYLAITRRFLAFLPFIGDLAELITDFMKYHFVFIDSQTGEKVGTYHKTTLFRDHYMLNMTDDSYAKLDRRAFAAIAVALDALQSR